MYLGKSRISLRHAWKKTKLDRNSLMNNIKNVRFNITFRINFHLFCMKKVKILCNSPIKGAKSVKWYHILVIAKKQRNEFVQEPSKYGQEPSPGSWGPRASQGSGSRAFDWRALRALKWPILKQNPSTFSWDMTKSSFYYALLECGCSN